MTPKYKRIESVLLERIQTGEYPENKIIPREVDLAVAFGVSRPTVRQAIQELVEQGYLERRRRRGTIVRTRRIRQEFTQVLENYNRELTAAAEDANTNVVSLGIEAATPDVQNALQLVPGAQVYHLVREREVDGKVTILIATYIPVAMVSDVLTTNFADTTLYAFLAQQKQAVAHVHCKLDLALASSETARALNISAGQPIFHFKTTGTTAANRVVEYSRAWYRGDVNSFEFDMQNQGDRADELAH